MGNERDEYDELLERAEAWADSNDWGGPLVSELAAAVRGLRSAFRQRCETARTMEEALDAVREAVAAQRDELAARLAWRPIETAPRDGTKILVRSRGPRPETELVFWVGDEVENGKYPWVRDCACSGVYHSEGDYTHWMPLPPPPEVKG